MSGLKKLIHEIHRRSLWQVLGVYTVAAWIGYEAIQSLTEGLGLPRWFPAFAVVLFIIGLPVVLATAFVQEGVRPSEPETPSAPLAGRDAPERETPRPRPPRVARRLFTWRNVISGAVLAFALWGVFAAGWLLLGREAHVAQPNEPTSTRAAAPVSTTPASATLSLETEPPGAAATVTALQPLASFASRQAIAVGRTPLVERPLPAGEYLVRLELDGWNWLEFLVSLEADDSASIVRRLVAAEPSTEGMLLITTGTYPGAPAGLAVQAFLIDRYEVTNAQYLEFVSAGGYRNPAFWPDTLIIDGQTTPWRAAMEAFVDRTELPGPRTWSGGLYPEGKSNHPVVGVSWYEARAYARWAGKELPTWDQWWRAALADAGGAFPWGDDVETTDLRANFSLLDTEPVGSHPLGVSPFGAHDMAGNVREWVRELRADPPRVRAVGGAWNAPGYTFQAVLAGAFEPDFADGAIGFRCVRAVPGQ